LNVIVCFYVTDNLTEQVADCLIHRDFQSMHVPDAFKSLFDALKGLSYYVDEDGVHCIAPIKNMPSNRTGKENKRYTGDVSRRNLLVTERIKDQNSGEFP
jgi:hypothetical protein